MTERRVEKMETTWEKRSRGLTVSCERQMKQMVSFDKLLRKGCGWDIYDRAIHDDALLSCCAVLST